jgi:pSer/pThr/pTyr-binding forkhead associated (FHA) protein
LAEQGVFFQACGAAGPLTLELLGPRLEAPERRAFLRPYVLLGRDPNNNICIESEYVSRRHLYLQLITGRLFFLDLESRTGVHHRGEPCDQGWLEPGESLRIGPITVRLPEDTESAGAPLAHTPPLPTDRLPEDQSLSPWVTLEITNREGRQIRWVVNRLLTLAGTSAQCKIRLQHPGVSRCHCCLLHTPEGVWVVDLLSRSGLVHNGRRVPWARLEDGDRLKLGSVLIRPWYDQVGPTAAPLLSESVRPQISPPGNGSASPMSGVLVPLLSVGANGEGSRQDAFLMRVVDQFGVMQQQMFEQFNQTVLLLAQMFSTLHREQMTPLREELNEVTRLAGELEELRAHLVQQAPAAPASSPQAEASQPVSPTPAPPRTNGNATPTRPADTPPNGPPTDANIHAWLYDRIARLDAERQGRWQKILNFVLGR